MRLLPHILLAYLAVGLQRGLDPWLGGRLGAGVAKVELPWIAAGFLAVTLPPEAAAVAGLAVGLAYDLTGTGPIGANALGLALGCYAASRLRPPRASALAVSLASVAASAAFVTAAAGLFRDGGQGILGGLGSFALTAGVGAALAWPLWKLRRLFGTDPRRR